VVPEDKNESPPKKNVYCGSESPKQEDTVMEDVPSGDSDHESEDKKAGKFDFAALDEE
jgi:hypothetical protein